MLNRFFVGKIQTSTFNKTVLKIKTLEYCHFSPSPRNNRKTSYGTLAPTTNTKKLVSSSINIDTLFTMDHRQFYMKLRKSWSFLLRE